MWFEWYCLGHMSHPNNPPPITNLPAAPCHMNHVTTTAPNHVHEWPDSHLISAQRMHTWQCSGWLTYARKTVCKMAWETAQQAIKPQLICNEIIAISCHRKTSKLCVPIQLCTDARGHLESTLLSPPGRLSLSPFQRTRPVLNTYLPGTDSRSGRTCKPFSFSFMCSQYCSPPLLPYWYNRANSWIAEIQDKKAK